INIGTQTVQVNNGNATVENTAEQINIGTQTVQVNNGNATVENTAEQINIGTQTVQVNNGNATVENTGEQINIGTQTVQAINGTETIINTNADTSNTVTAEIPTQNNLPNTNNFIPTNESLNLQNEGTNQNTNNTTNSQETNTLSTTTTSDIISTATPSNNNQTANTTTAQSQTESSINNTTDTQQILKIIDTPNTNPLTVATDSNQVVMMLEENRLKEFSNYFGEDLAEQLVNTKSVRDILTDMAKQTGKESAVVYIKAYPEQLQLILYTKSGQPIIKTIADAKHKQLKRLVKKLRHEIINSETDSYLTPAQQLYDWLIAPISAELEAANINTLLFSMDEGLRTLPVAVLHDGSQFLIEKYSLSLIPSVSLMDTNYRPLQDTQVLAMGASKFTSESPLPAVPIELETISQNLWQGSKFINEEFTRNNLLNQRKNYPYPIIHLATHAEFLPGSANTSYIHLWGDDKIRLDEIRELGWSQPAVDLLVLSACKTAFGDKNAELGFAGFAVAAGVKSALASIWYVSDEGTLGLMTEFYTHLNNAKIKVEALRQAQLAMLRGEVVIADGELRGSGTRGAVVLPSALGDVENNNLSHPYYWAGFTMIGSPW
ncbi:MAG: CHAT domain-containing protein, partial [Cyanobacteria bacterium P01_H01_bin.35]